ncbi:unnamed protein product [Kuraishia capsulata CBS 1993]|uniref:Amidase domain-containing protein n=1 Tax=Kuraishia capsulata CBS 1993 TaxID=1382522 RepID=W6MN78_9ASCO|nr:uncharacterized protein KUCA_T00002459001 [Kuraishia capsulata CBS 1993]CDK26487.1 unnamed protein product [Kuraishia capsulata CBS 1993]
MFGAFTNDISDPAKFAEWEPKIKAYREAVAAGVLDEFKAPESLIPGDIDTKGYNATVLTAKFLTADELAIVDTPGYKLVEKLAKGELTAVETFKAFAKAGTLAHQALNCAMELFPEYGLKRAEELDAYYAKTGKTVGPLHGLPISLKEHYNFAGHVTHAAYVSLLDNVTPEHAYNTKILEDAGAVFYIRTSEPQCLMHLCSGNNITGRTRNPYRSTLTTGGSSSGEGAIAAMKGSVFGIGSDIGGSIRCPAAFCGVWGLRPSQKRITLKNVTSCYTEGVQEAVYVVLGPLARCAEDLDLCMKVVLGAKPWEHDALLVPLPWRDVPFPAATSLTVAIAYDDGVVAPHPPILRGLKEAAAKLAAAGVKVVEWKPIRTYENVCAVASMYNADGNSAQRELLAAAGEPLFPLTEVCLSFGCGDAGVSGKEAQRLAGIRDSTRQEFLDAMNAQGIDYLLTPTYNGVAAKPDVLKYWGYTSLYNVLDYPSVIFPTGLYVDPALDPVDTKFVPRSDIEKYEHALYDDPKEFEGAPIALQLIGRRYKDEEVVKASKVVAEIIQA